MAFSTNIKYLDKCHITTMLQLCAFPKSTLQMQQKRLKMQHKICFGLQIPKKTYPKVAFHRYFHECSNYPPRVTETMMHTDLPAVLEKLRQSPKIKDAFLDNLLTREEWVSILGFHRTTLWRWEEDIINKIPPLKTSYYESERGLRSNYLDPYQRFLSAVIFLLKDESIKKGVRNNSQVIQFLKFNFMHLRRKNFEQWQENQ